MNPIPTRAIGLDSPVWTALTSVHEPLAIVHGRARRYPSEISRFAAVSEPSEAAFADLRAIVEPGDEAALLSVAPLVLPDGWRRVHSRTIDQMAYAGDPVEGSGDGVLELGVQDAAEMLALATATQPGPFRSRTHEMGRYLGVRADDGALVAMGGERLRLAAATELSAICTAPAYQGRGYARRLLGALIEPVLEQGRLPFLHVKTENRAKALYEALGFELSRRIHLTVVAPR
jgi:ribosomal protein S18 acetylase RimI-like enzyme